MGYPVYEGSLEGRDFLNGIEVAPRFFAEWGLPFLQERFPELVERTAARAQFRNDVALPTAGKLTNR
jgi:hypothetical protein